jgi:surface polysaccharide O-acyltransferase-like enzyme
MKPAAPAFSAGAPPAARDAYLDTLRGWSIFGVVCIHFAGSFVTSDAHAWSPSFLLGLALNQGFIFAVPLFVFLSGLLAGASQRQPTLGEYYRGRAERILFPYLIVSGLSFFLLNHSAAWLALPGTEAKLTWLVTRVAYLGVEPTLYFIPMILLLYVAQPALKALPGWLHGLAPGVSATRFAVLLTGLLLVVHGVIGLLCYTSRLNYYTWGRPNPLFWLFYFFAGLHFRTLTAALTPAAVRAAGWSALIVAVGAMGWNFLQITDPAVVGQQFERNRLDFAYVRPEMLVYDLAVVLALAAGLVLGWSPRAGVMAWLGRYTLEIYLWHILVLYFAAWQFPGAMAACRDLPEVIVLICAAATLFIAATADGWARLKTYVRQHRLALIREP